MAERLGDAVLEISTDDRNYLRGIRESERKARQLQSGFGRTGRAAGRLGAGLTALGGRMQSLGRSMIGLKSAAVGLGAALALRAIVKTAAEFQQLRLQLETVTGSAGAANDAFKGILKFASKTPFEVQNITKSFVLLKAVGIEPTTDLMLSIGNTAAAFGKDITEFSEAVIGAVTGESDRLKQFGIVARIEGDKVTFITNGIQTTVANNATAIVGFLKKIGETRFAGSMARQANSITGAFSNLQDALSGAEDAIGRAGLNALLETLARDLTDFVNGSTKDAAGFSAKLLEIVGNFALGAADMIDFVEPIFDAVAGGINRLIRVFNTLPPILQQIGLLGFLLLGFRGKVAMVAVAAVAERIIKSAEDARREAERDAAKTALQQEFQRRAHPLERRLTEITGMSLSEVAQLNTLDKFGSKANEIKSILRQLLTLDSEIKKRAASKDFGKPVSDQKRKEGAPAAGFNLSEISLFPQSKGTGGARAAVEGFLARWRKRMAELKKQAEETGGAISNIGNPPPNAGPTKKELADAASIFKATRTAAELYQMTIDKLDNLLKKGAISQDTYNRAVQQAKDALNKAKDGVDGVAKAIQDAAEPIGTAFEDAVVNGEKLRDVINALEKDLLRIMSRELITKPLEKQFKSLLGVGEKPGTAAGAPGVTAGGVRGGGLNVPGGLIQRVGTWLGNSLFGFPSGPNAISFGDFRTTADMALSDTFSSSFLHSGGTVGFGGARRRVPAAWFANAPRFHSGGPVLGPREVPIVAQKGEKVLTAAQAKGGGRNDRRQVINNWNFPNANPDGFRASQPQIQRMTGRSVLRAMRETGA